MVKHSEQARWRYYAKLLFLSLFLIGRLAEDLHQASVQHAICAEHGELIEITASAQDLAAAHTHDGGRQLVAATEDEGHDHCPLAQLQRERPLPLDLTTTRVSEPLGEARLLDVPVDACVPAIPRFLLAPKHSPPRERTTC